MRIDILTAGDSCVARIDPRVRLAAAAAFSILAAVSYRMPALWGALVASAAIAALAHLPPGVVLRRLIAVNAFTAMLWAIVPFTVPGETLLHLGPLSASRDGVRLAAQVTLKSNAIVLCFMALVATMVPATLGHALHRLRVPDKIVHLLLMTYRYIFVLEDEYRRLARAARMRGFRPGTNLHTYRTYAYLVGMLFVRAAERAERVHWAMLCRGFRRRFYSLQEFRLGVCDVLFAAGMTVLITALSAAEIGWR
jgi:cobalt/nickel transport system permease protein